MADPERYRVGDLIVDLGRGRVWRGDTEITPPRLSFELFIVLLRAAPNLLSLDDLMQQVWPGLVVSPETVSQRVKLLRDVLGDDPRNPTYIGGVRGRGYQIVAPVQRLTEPAGSAPRREVLAQPEAGLATAAAPPVRTTSRRALWIGAAIALLGVAFASWKLVSQRIPTSTPTSVIVQQVPPRSVAVLPFESLGDSPEDRPIALGVSVAVLDQLARLDQLLVIARTSSFALDGQHRDARELGRLLNARYLLSGSVQRDKQQLRITAQLVNTDNGTQVWSMLFDRPAQDLFAVQDEIAVDVTRALRLTLDSAAVEKLTRRGTTNIEASLAYQQGVALLATRKFADLQAAKQRFAEAIRLDPKFAAPRSALAEAHGQEVIFPLSEFWFTRVPKLPPAVLKETEQLLKRAIELDPQDGNAYFVRGWLERDYTQAAADFRRGIELSPNNAIGIERFARLLFFFPSAADEQAMWDADSREESFVLIDQALQLDPLRATNYLSKALMVLYGRSNVPETNTLLLRALQRDPNYYPALMRLAELRWCCEGKFAEAIRYGEQALAMEPQAAWPRHFLVPFYVDIGDLEAARQLAGETQRTDPLVSLALLAAEGKFKAAADIVYAAEGSISGLDGSFMVRALLQGAGNRAEARRARKSFEDYLEIKWTSDGPRFYDDYEAVVSLADLMMRDGERERATSLLRQMLIRIEREAVELHRGELWFGYEKPRALALLGDKEAALESFRKAFDMGFKTQWKARFDDPVYDLLRGDPRFEALRADTERQMVAERAALEAARVAGEVPRRDATGMYIAAAPRTSAPADDRSTGRSSPSTSD